MSASIPRRRDLIIAAALMALATVISLAAMREFRAGGLQPFFYQSNFEPAVMLSCGRGMTSLAVKPPALTAFLNVQRDDFDCGELPAAARLPLTTPANANWYYMYAAAAAVWRVTGVSWIALDWLVSVMAGVVTVSLYGLFRLATSAGVAAALSLVLTLSPVNLTQLLSLRDYSKAPFVLAAVFILGVMIAKPMSRRMTLALAAAFGLIVGAGYGFRSDLVIMVPLGVAVMMLFLPGKWRINVVRNVLAPTLMVVAFVISAAPVLAGLSLGGCQYHFSLLGFTDPMTSELRLDRPLYSLGAHFSDTFVDLKVGDYSSRMQDRPVPGLCTAEYDEASGEIYSTMLQTFPADVVVRAYSSVLMILRVGLDIPAASIPAAPFATHGVATVAYDVVHRVTSLLAPAGILFTIAAAIMAGSISIRLGLAVTFIVLFLTGYPSIRFDARHWFHLRFIPWWAAAFVLTTWLSHRRGGLPSLTLKRGLSGAALVLASMTLALVGVRAWQSKNIEALVLSYLDAATESLVVQGLDAHTVAVDWERPETRGAFRASELVVVNLAASSCAGDGPLAVTAVYGADVPSHDMGASYAVERPRGGQPTRLFVPVFRLNSDTGTLLRFAALKVSGAGVECLGQPARIRERRQLPLWLDLHVPEDWRDRPLYQTMRAIRLRR